MCSSDLIPTCVINHFLDDVAKHGRYTGFVDLGIELQRCENPAVRAVAGLTGSASGLMVKKLHPMCPLRETLRKGDVITHVDGVAAEGGRLLQEADKLVERPPPGDVGHGRQMAAVEERAVFDDFVVERSVHEADLAAGAQVDRGHAGPADAGAEDRALVVADTGVDRHGAVWAVPVPRHGVVGRRSPDTGVEASQVTHDIEQLRRILSGHDIEERHTGQDRGVLGWRAATLGGPVTAGGEPTRQRDDDDLLGQIQGSGAVDEVQQRETGSWAHARELAETSVAQAVAYLAVAPKSNAVYNAYNQARALVRANPSNEVPLHLRNAPTKLMKNEGYGAEYHYAHDFPDAFVDGENYFPSELRDTRLYEPVERGLEIRIAEKLRALRKKNADSEWRRYED